MAFHYIKETYKVQTTKTEVIVQFYLKKTQNAYECSEEHTQHHQLDTEL